jgi:hypothetical protein
MAHHELEPPDPTWLRDIDMDVLVVRRYDQNDVLINYQYFVLLQDDLVDDGYIVSSVAEPPEPEIE